MIKLPNTLLETLFELDRNARAYGWEVGNGKRMTDTIEMSPENPFLDENWTDKVEDDDSSD